MYEEVLSTFQRNNSSAVSSFMVDKDFAELAALSKIWPHAKVELCLFHVLKSAKLKICSLEISKDQKDQLKETFQSIAYAASEEMFQIQVAKLEKIE